MIRSILIDDEEKALSGLQLALEKFCPTIQVIALCATPEDGLEKIKSEQPDLIFLDVQMPRMSGFNLLEAAGDFNFEVIFVTAYDRYAIKAIKFSALGYLLKPLDINELQNAVHKAEERIQLKNSRYHYDSLLKNVKNNLRKMDKLAIPTLDGMVMESLSNIIYCEASRNYTHLIMIDGRKLIVSKNLKDFEDMLCDSGFFRVHHAYLVNLSHIKRYIKGEGGYVILEGGHHVDVSKRKKESFLQQLPKI